MLVGFFLPAAFLADVALAIQTRHDASALWPAAGAPHFIVLNLMIFMIWTLPINKATRNWTARQENWQAQRRQGTLARRQCRRDVAGLLRRNAGSVIRAELSSD